MSDMLHIRIIKKRLNISTTPITSRQACQPQALHHNNH